MSHGIILSLQKFPLLQRLSLFSPCVATPFPISSERIIVLAKLVLPPGKISSASLVGREKMYFGQPAKPSY
jgi:hypothetical protein